MGLVGVNRSLVIGAFVMCQEDHNSPALSFHRHTFGEHAKEMSGVLWLDKVPHIVRYGRHSEEDEACWIWFWRNGVRFIIDVDGKDIRRTSFYDPWKSLLTEWRKGEESLARRLEQQWFPMCDMIISASRSTLRDLAPDGQHWTTLREVLHTPAYRLRLLASGKGEWAKAEVTEGPTDEAAYDLYPAITEMEFSPANHLERFDSEELSLLNMSRDWLKGPKKVRTKNGRVFFFQGCAKSIRNDYTQKVTNTSLDSIRAQIHISSLLHKKGELSIDGSLPVAVPQVCGIVVDGVRTPGARKEDSTNEARVAGVLVPWLSGARTLSDVIQSALKSSSVSTKVLTSREEWKVQIQQAVDFLHRHGVSFGGESNWSYLNQRSIVIDDNWKAWLTMLPTFVTVEGGPHEETKPQKAVLVRDIETVKVVFDEWLPVEMAKAPTFIKPE